MLLLIVEYCTLTQIPRCCQSVSLCSTLNIVLSPSTLKWILWCNSTSICCQWVCVPHLCTVSTEVHSNSETLKKAQETFVQLTKDWEHCAYVRSERTMDLMLQLHNNMTSGILWSGVSGRQLGKLEPCASTMLNLSVIAIRTGLLVSWKTFFMFFFRFFLFKRLRWNVAAVSESV